jgi:hypothetical protein
MITHTSIVVSDWIPLVKWACVFVFVNFVLLLWVLVRQTPKAGRWDWLTGRRTVEHDDRWSRRQ